MSKRFLASLTLLASLGFTVPSLTISAQDKDKHDDWESRNGYEYHTYDGQRPPGWNKGKKTGWDNCGGPPGKKYDCRTYTYQGRPYYYYQGEDGHMYVRRPASDHDHDNH
jgi:hypothetical protein